MIRKQLIEQIIRLVYGSQPSDDASITPGLVNQMINQAIGTMARLSYKESIQLDGIGYINNSFYTTFKDITIFQDEQFTYRITLPQVPISLGKNEGISVLKLKDPDGEVSRPVIWISQDQVGYYQSMPQIPNKILAYYQGNIAYMLSTLQLNEYKAQVTIVSGGDSNNLDSQLNVPDDFISGIVDMVVKSLVQSRAQIRDSANDGVDSIQTS
jgi:hypothetical protein